MKTKHYIVKNIAEFSEQTEAVEKLGKYLNYIEEIAFPSIEEVFGQEWGTDQINIELDGSSSVASYRHREDSHLVKMGINNSNIRREYPDNLWGCLFHETHHAFLDLIIQEKKRDGKFFNGGHKAEVFNYAFMATTYLNLKKESKIEPPKYEYFLSKLRQELYLKNKEYRSFKVYEYERELPDNAMDIFQEYIGLFSSNSNFAKFISYVKAHDTVFIKTDNFNNDLSVVREYLAER